MSPELKRFYVELQAWIDGGCPNNGGFAPYYGLCSNLGQWSERRGYITSRLRYELDNQFRYAGLDKKYPWGYESYNERQIHRSMYECPHRLAWIKEHAQ